LTGSSSPSERNYITIVTGLPRSGTSMLMQMLEAGGMDTLIDDHLVADIDNPGGYYEYEPIGNIEWKNEWVSEAMGKAMKLLAAGIRHLPPDFKYKLVYITRDVDEMRISLKKLLIRKGVEPDFVSVDEIETRREQGLRSVQRWAEESGNELLIVDYNDTLREPVTTVQQMSVFLDGLNADAMVEAVNPEYYRNRVVGI